MLDQTIPTHNEAALLLNVSKGDEKAFEKLMLLYANHLATYIFRLTHDREQTEEIVQDIFLKIWLTRERLEDVRSFRTYLFVISRNRTMNILRALIREKRRAKEWEAVVENTNEDDKSAEREYQYNLLEEAIAQLPSQQKKAWMLSRMQRLKYKEIAIEMGLSEETVKKYIQYASVSISKYIEAQLVIAIFGVLVAKL